MSGLSEQAALCLCCKGHSVLFHTERAFYVSIYCYDPVRSWHLKLKVCIVRYRFELCKRGASEQSMIAAAERNYVED